MDVPQAHQPDFVSEQLNADRDPVFKARLVEIGERFATQKKRIIFISRAWPFDGDPLGVNEGWSEIFPDILCQHLQLLGFQVILDKNDLGVGKQLNHAMEKSVDKADHVLLLVTRTYIHKANNDPLTGVAREMHYIGHKIKAMDPEGINGWIIAGKRRFVLPLAFNDTRGFPLADSHPGIATIFVQNVGYRRALIDLAEKVYRVEPALLREIVPSRAHIVIQAVKRCYQERRYIYRPFHAEPMPIEKGYVRLAIVKEEEQREKEQKQFSAMGNEEKQMTLFEDKRLTSFEQIYGAKEPVNIEDIFKPGKEKKDKKESKVKIPKRLLVLGRAGIGKSTLCHKMAHQWANSENEAKLWEENGQEKFKLVLWIPLRNLLDYPPAPDATICDAVLRECIASDHTGEKIISREAVLRGLKELKPEEILYVCDGYDEVEGRTTPLIEKLLAQENVILTSRPHGINQYLTSNARPFDRKFENIGFLDEDIEKYMQAFFGDENQPQAKSLIYFLKAHPSIWGTAHVPINLMLICAWWEDSYKTLDLKKIKDITMTDLYLGLVTNLGRRFLDKSKVKGLHDFMPEEILEHEKCKPVLYVLSNVAFKQMSHESLLVPGEAFSRIQLRKPYSGSSSLREDVLQFGVLTPTSNETNKPMTQFYFVHLTFQEFLAAFYIAERLRANDEQIKHYILRNKYCRRHEMVWWFVAGLLKEKTKILEIFFDILEAEPRDLEEMDHPMLLMRCMDECQLKVNPERRRIYLSNLCQLMDVGLESDFYKTFSIYLNLSEVVFNQPEVVEKFCEHLNGNDYSNKYGALKILKNFSCVSQKIMDCICGILRSDPVAREAAVRCFKRKEEVSEEIQLAIVDILKDTDHLQEVAVIVDFFVNRSEMSKKVERKMKRKLRTPNEFGRIGALMFFTRRSHVSEEIQRDIAKLLRDPLEYVRGHAVDFFTSRKKVSEEIQRNIAKLLRDPDGSVIRAAVNFFSNRKWVSEEIQRSIAKLLGDSLEYVRRDTVDFFTSRKEVSEEIQRSIAKLLGDLDGSVICAAVNFFSNRKSVSEEIQRDIAKLLWDPIEYVRRDTVDFFCSRKEVSEEIQIRRSAVDFFTSRKEVSEEIQRSIAKMLGDPDLYVRRDAVDFFASRQAVSEEIHGMIAELLKSPQRYVNADAMEFFPSREDFSQARAVSHMGLLPSPGKNSEGESGESTSKRVKIEKTHYF